MPFYFGNSKECPIFFPLSYYILGILLASILSIYYHLFIFLLMYSVIFFLSGCSFKFRFMKLIGVAFFFIWIGLYSAGSKLDNTQSPEKLHHYKPYRILGLVKKNPLVTKRKSTVYIEVSELLDSQRFHASHLNGQIIKLIVPEKSICLMKGQKISTLLYLESKQKSLNRFSRHSLIPTFKGAVKSSAEIHVLSDANIFERFVAKTKREINRVFQSLSNPKAIGVLRGVLLGDKRGLTKDLKKTFRACGLSHILVVSGFHIGIVFAFFFMLFKWILKRWRWLPIRFDINVAASIVAILPVIFYAYMIDLPYPTLRSAIMLFVLIMCLLSGRTIIAMNVFMWALFLILLFNPLSLFSISFQLSCAAVFGILYGISRIRPLYSDRRHRGKFKIKDKIRLYFLDLALVSLLAITFTFPLSAYYFKSFSAIGFFVNILFVPIFSLTVFPLGIVSMLATMAHIPGAEFLWKINSVLVIQIIALLSTVLSFPYALVKTKSFYIEHVVFSYCLFIAFLSVKKR